MADSRDWIARDAAVVWHGFTQMAAYADNRPVIVAGAEGRELIDVDGRRYLDAISSLWVTTLGHRIPELDDAVRGQLFQQLAGLLGDAAANTIEQMLRSVAWPVGGWLSTLIGLALMLVGVLVVAVLTSSAHAH